ncbi:MAG TPA: YqgE/AlgH family protein [Candidatus Margulisiibacteriota bacterium]|nr:YqgE/AlgH family protein [Candidatus Margulisiibacteriota bacterium]
MHHPVLALATLALSGLHAPCTARPEEARIAPAVTRYQPKLDKGMLLVASRDLSDPNFSQTVVLLIAYGPNGTMGVIVNRPSEVKLATALPRIKALHGRSDLVYLGGPVLANRVLLLIRAAKAPEDSLAVFDDVYASSSMDVLKHQIEQRGSKEGFRAYAGHAGWAPGQLEAEIARGDWYVTPADAASVLSPKARDLWRTLIERVEGDWVREGPFDPTKICTAPDNRWAMSVRALSACCPVHATTRKTGNCAATFSNSESGASL